MDLQEIKAKAYGRGMRGWNTCNIPVSDLLDIIFELESLRRRNEPTQIQDVPAIGYTGCLICGAFTDHGGLQCPKLRAYSGSAQ